MENKILAIIKNNWKNGLLPILLFWLMLWSGYNANFWRVTSLGFPDGALDLIQCLRAYLPILAGIFAVILLFFRRHFLSKRFFLTPLGLLSIYTLVGVISAFFSKDLFRTLYSDFMYGSVIVVLLPFLCDKNFLKNISSVINLNWAIAFILAVALAVFFLIQPGVVKSLSYNFLICQGRPYEVLGTLGAGANVLGMAGTRPTGWGRYAGVAAIVCLACFCFAKKKIKAIWLVLFIIFLAILIFSRGRTEVAGFFIAAIFLFLLARKYKYFLYFGAGFLIFLIGFSVFYQAICYPPVKNVSSAVVRQAKPVEVKASPATFFTKNSDILTLSGRVNGIWRDSWIVFLKNPVIGQGFQADKSLTTAHNTILHALVQAGILGTIPFVLAFLLIFLILWRLFKNPNVSEKERNFLIVITSALVFFVVRSITESMAVYSADWLFVAPIIAYIQCLDYELMVKNKNTSMGFNGIKINIIKMSEVLEKISFWIRQEKNKLHWIVATGMHGIVEAEKNPDFKQIISHADLFVPDGISLVWLARLKGFDIKKRVSGADLMAGFFKAAEKENFSNYFYGDTEDTLCKLNKKLSGDFPNLKIVGSYSPPFREPTKEEDEKIIEKINQAKPDVLWVGLGLPKQEKWIFEHREKLNVPVVVGVGAAFKFLSGKVKRAPEWVGNAGFEWLWRLVQEPKTTWKRVFFDIPVFLRVVAKENKFGRLFYVFFKSNILIIEKYFFWPSQRFFGAELLEQLTPYDVEGFEEKIRLGNSYDGGYLIPRNIIPLIEVAYIYGVADDIKFEEDLLKYKDIPIRLYDHTIDNLPRTNKNMFFKKQGIAAKKHGNFDTFENHIKENQDGDKKILLKMDIEGDEWEIIDKIVSSYSENIVAIILEMHKFYRYEKFIKYIKKLSKINSKFTLVHIHGNNWSGLVESSTVKIGNKEIPNVCELTFINNSLVKNKIIMPHDLPSVGDCPNAPQKKDISLNFWKKDRY